MARDYEQAYDNVRGEYEELYSAHIATMLELSEAVAALRFYADQFCEYGTSNEGCGKFDDDTCSGCKARAAVVKFTGGL
jgi:hypothetical protein